MLDGQFKIRVDNWRKDFAKIGKSMSETTDKEGRYPHIDFEPLQIEMEKIIMALANSREPNLVATPLSLAIVDAQGNAMTG